MYDFHVALSQVKPGNYVSDYPLSRCAVHDRMGHIISAIAVVKRIYVQLYIASTLFYCASASFIASGLREIGHLCT